MRKPFLLSLLVALLTTLSTLAYDFKYGDLYYNILNYYTVEVTYQEYQSTSNYQGLTTATIPATVTYYGTVYSVTSIGGSAFKNCSSLTSITIPNSVTSIGGSAFYGCSSLTKTNYTGDIANWCNIQFTNYTANPTSFSKNLYLNDVLVTDLVIPQGVIGVGDYAFDNCSSLTSVTIPNSVTSIGVDAFGYCSSLTSITIPNSVTSIGDYAFENCSALTSITIGSSVTSIGYRAFYGCSSLTKTNYTGDIANWCNIQFTNYTANPTSFSKNLYLNDVLVTDLVIPQGVIGVGDYAFDNCSSLTSIILPNSVTSIGRSAFNSCSSLTSITIPNSVTSIGDDAFYECSSLTPIIIPNSVTSIGYNAFYNVPNIVYSGTAIGSPWGARNVVNVYVDGYLVYADETKTTLLACSAAATGEVTLPNSVTSIGDYAFDNCSSLTSITLPNSVTSIGDGAFRNCSGLTEFTIPENITYLGDQVFEGCSGITSITWNAKRCQDRWKDLYYYSQLPFYGIYSQISSFTFGKTVDSIPSTLCYEMSNLSSITIPENVKHIGGGVFINCTGLTSVAWNAINCSNDVGDGSGNVWLIFNNANAHITSFTLGEKVEVIPHFLCYGLSELTSITIPNSVKTIGSHAFRDCSGLTAIGIPENVSTIYGAAFQGCTNITSIAIPQNVRLIFPYTFADCVNLSTIELPNEIDTIGRFAFSGCRSLTDFSLPSATTIIGTGCFYNCSNLTSLPLPENVTIVNDSTFYGCSSLTSITLPNSVTSIGGSAFRDCSSLSSVNIGNSVTSIGGSAFRDCSSLTSITLPNSLTSIEYSTFSGCTALASVIIPSSVTMIDEYAFGGCLKLRDVYCYPATPPTAQINSFANYNVYVHVPCASLDAYDMDVVFGSFKYVECIGSEDAVITDKTVSVVPGDADATFTWPVTDNADTYSLVITKDGVTFCTLVFNAQGQLVSIAFKPRRQNAPAAEGTTPATYAEMTANGFRFTVTGLNEGSAYAYTLTVRNAANTVLETYTGDFTTLSGTPMGINESAGEDAHAHGQVEKILREGQVLILRNGETYDMMGQRL